MGQLLDKVWPLPFRKLTSEVVKTLTHQEFFSLTRLVYRRNRKHQAKDAQARSLVRRLMRRRHGLKLFPELKTQAPDMFWAKYKDNTILNALYPARQQRWAVPVSRKNTVCFNLEGFSFVDAPNETMRKLRDIAVAECEVRAGRLDFGDNQILDIGPYVVWGLMSKGMAPFLIGGVMNVSVQKVIEAVGLREFMRMEKFQGLKDEKDVWAFKLRQRNPGKHTATPERAIGFSKVADDLVDTVNEWLGALPIPMELRDPAKPRLNKIVTEILDNAERHGRPGGETGDWYVAGFMARRELKASGGESREWYDCHVAMVNLGTTIAKSILQTPVERVRKNLNLYIARHHSRFGSSKNALATLYAMQDDVSSLPGRGGKGMMDMIELTNVLGSTDDENHQPAITIISGKSCVRFAGPYKGCFPMGGEGPRRVQSFDTRKTFEFPPDGKYVSDLDDTFPGTIVAMRFSLDHEALEARTHGSD